MEGYGIEIYYQIIGTSIEKATREFPAVVLTGPRQSGKTTLLQYLFGAHYRYVSLEPPDIQVTAREDPRGFLEMHPSLVIFDEIQYAPHLLPYIKEKIDANRQKTGQFLITGSQNLLIMEKVTESLAGRAAILRLLPLSRKELEGCHSILCHGKSSNEPPTNRPIAFVELWKNFLRG